jgi:muconate cycloisomerase
MVIKRLTAFAVRLPLRRTIRHASFSRTETENLLIRCELNDGTVGWGEGVPRSYVTGETIDSAITFLQKLDWPNLVSDWQWSNFAAAVRSLEDLSLPAVPGDDRHIRTNAVRCALELALLDAAGQKFKQPLSSVAALIAPELYETKDRVQYSGAITSATGLRAWVTAWAMRIYGFAHIKVKVGISGQDDVARLRLIRQALGDRMSLRIDANEAWSPGSVEARICELLPFRLDAVEQPVGHAHVSCLTPLRARLQVPIMLDESLCSMVDASAAVAAGTCDFFNLRLSKCGGFISCLRLAQFAQQHNLGYQLGCQVGESGILSAAGRHFATSVVGIRFLEGSFDRRLLAHNIISEDITFGRGGWAPALTGPGLGIRVDEARIRKLPHRVLELWHAQ